MGWGGHVLDMINRMKQNEALKNRKWEIQSRIQKAQNKNSKYSNIKGFPQEKELTEEEGQKIILKIRRENFIDRIKKGVALFLSIVIIILLTYLLFFR